MPSTHSVVWVDTENNLISAIKRISSCTKVGVDTVSNSLFAYQEQICLIQISTPRFTYLIDTLALTNIARLKSVFENPRIQKIFHAAEYDLICLNRDFGFKPKNLFDTMLVSRILSLPEVGLAALLIKYFNEKVDKHFQKANWGQRPLPDALKQYAAIDSRHLIALGAILTSDLKKHRLFELAKEDFIRLENIKNPVLKQKSTCLNTNGKGRMTPRQLAVLQALCEYRDHEAQRRDIPHFKVLGDDALVELAKKSPKKFRDLENIAHLSPKQIHIHGANLLKSISRGITDTPPSPKTRVSVDRAFILRIERLKHWRKQIGLEMHMDSDVILPKDTLEVIARQNPSTQKQLEKSMAGQKWRIKNFGNAILNALSSPEKQ